MTVKPKVKRAGLALVATLLVVFAVAPAALAAPAAPAHPTHRPTVTLTGNLAGQPILDSAGNQVGSFVSGTAKVTHVSVVNGHMVGSGVVNGVVTMLGGAPTTVSNVPFANALLDPPAACTILDLTLGPINLNLLGLTVTTNTIHLNISAVPGPGNLLGNLLCSVANLLNGTGGLGATLQNLLNRINAILGGLGL